MRRAWAWVLCLASRPCALRAHGLAPLHLLAADLFALCRYALRGSALHRAAAPFLGCGPFFDAPGCRTRRGGLGYGRGLRMIGCGRTHRARVVEALAHAR